MFDVHPLLTPYHLTFYLNAYHRRCLNHRIETDTINEIHEFKPKPSNNLISDTKYVSEIRQKMVQSNSKVSFDASTCIYFCMILHTECLNKQRNSI